MLGSTKDESSNGIYATQDKRCRVTSENHILSFHARKKGEYLIPYDRVRDAIVSSYKRPPLIPGNLEVRLSPYSTVEIGQSQDGQFSLRYDGHHLVLNARKKGVLRLTDFEVYALIETYERQQDINKRNKKEAQHIRAEIKAGRIPKGLADLVHQETVEDSSIATEEVDSITEFLDDLRRS